MAPRTKQAVNSLSGFLDSGDEASDVDMMPTPDSNQENHHPVVTKSKRARKPAAATATASKRGKPASRRLSGGKSKTTRASKRRAPLKDQTNEQHASDTEEVDDDDDDGFDNVPANETKSEPSEEPAVVPAEEKKPAKKGRPPGRGKKAVAAAKEPVEPSEEGPRRDGEFEYTPTTARTTKKLAKGRAAKKEAEAEKVEAAKEDVQPPEETETNDSTMLSIEQDEEVPPRQEVLQRPASLARSNSRQPAPNAASNAARRRAGSASDTERQGNDPALRRKLGEMTRKFENLEVKYRNLRDVGIKEAEANFERLRKQSEGRTKASNDLIASLRSEIAIQKDVNKDARNHQSDLSATQTSLREAEKRISELTNSLTQAQNENRNLQAKLTAARATSAAAEAKVPSSAIKGKPTAAMTKAASTEAAHAAQLAQLKEDLYSDLTGLILRSVDRQEESDVYDCIQTGRNGTLHFKLAVAVDKGNATSYEETEFLYTPRLDENRDRDLIDILPDYLTEEITFSRVNAAKFYSRVMDTLTRKVVD